MSLADYLRALRRRWRVVLVAALLGGVLGAVYVVTVPERYEAEAQVLVTADGGGDATTTYDGLLFLQQRVKSYAGALTSPFLLNSVIEELGLATNAADLADSVEVVVPLDTAVLSIRVTDESPEGAAAVAQTLGEQFILALPQLENISADVIPVSARMLGPAAVPEDPVRPQPLRDVAVALALGALAGAALALLRETTDLVVKDETSVRAVTDATIVGSIPAPGSRSEPTAVVQRGDTRPRAQAYRVVQANLAMVDDAHPRSLLVTSSVAAEGKSALAANLALATAETGARVCLVETDLRRPEVLGLFGIEEGVGLVDVIDGDAALDDVLDARDQSGLHLLGAGSTLPTNPTELLGGPAMAAVLRELQVRYDLVVLDSPPLLPVADALILSRSVDQVVLVVGAGRSRTDQLAETLESLDRVGATVRGLVLDEGVSQSRWRSRGMASPRRGASGAARAGNQGAGR